MEHLALMQYVLLGILGLIAGVINMMAGGGSNLILPVLMMFGIPADVANSSNRVGVLLQSISGLQGFNKEGKLPKQDLLAILLPTLIGGLCGALIAAFSPTSILKPMLLITMLIVAAIAFFKPSSLVHQPDVQPIKVSEHPRSRLWLCLTGVYGGFVQAGVGFVLLPVLAGVLRYDLVRANALKVCCSFGFTLVSICIFMMHGQIRWDIGLVLALGSFIGAKVGVKTAVRLKPQVLRWILFVMTLVAVVIALFK